MSFDFLRTLPRLIQPLPIVWAVLTLGCVRNLWRRRLGCALAWLLPWGILSVFCCTALPSTLVFSLERHWLGAKLDDLPQCDAIVCLGGGAEAAPNEPTGFHLERGGDRITTAILLARSGKGKNLVVSGGVIEENGRKYPEADAVAAWLEKLQLCSIPVLSLGGCVDTHDESLKIATLCKERHWDKILLLTSASHLDRAEATFRKSGVNVVCFPCNFLSSQSRVGVLNWVHWPDYGSLDEFDVWWHETIGWIAYRWKGWI